MSDTEGAISDTAFTTASSTNQIAVPTEAPYGTSDTDDEEHYVKQGSIKPSVFKTEASDVKEPKLPGIPKPDGTSKPSIVKHEASAGEEPKLPRRQELNATSEPPGVRTEDSAGEEPKLPRRQELNASSEPPIVRTEASAVEEPKLPGLPNPHGTPASSIVTSEISDQIQKSLQQAVEESLTRFRNIMNVFVDSKTPYKSSEIRQFQQKTRDKILEKFEETYSKDLAPNDPNNLISAYKLKLVEGMDSPDLSSNFLARYDHSINNALKDLRICTLEAEQVYEDEMENFEGKPEIALEQKHDRAKQKALEKFQELVQAKDLNFDDPLCRKEIEWKLHENFNQLQNDTNFGTSLGSIKQITASNVNQDTTNPDQNPTNPALLIPTNPDQNSSQEFNLGAFLDNESIKLYTLNKAEMEGKIQKISEICNVPLKFNLDPSEPNPGSAFDIYKLMTENLSTCHMVESSQANKFMSTDDILTQFFKMLFSEIKNSAKIDIEDDSNIQLNLVITSAFPWTSYQKERLQISARKGYFRKVRVISSTTATAVKLFFDKPSQLNPEEDLKDWEILGTKTNDIVQRIIVVHPTELSFTMSLVELKPGTIIESKACLGSLNDETLSQFPFKQSHYNVFTSSTENSSNRDTHYYKVLQAYKQVRDQLLGICNLGLPGIQTVVLVGQVNDKSVLIGMLKETFETQVFVKEGQDSCIQGACIIASKVLEQQNLNFQVRDYSGSVFKVFVNTQQEGEESSRELSVQGLGLVNYSVQMQNQGFVTVWEVLQSGVAVPACQYFLTAEPLTPRELLDVRLTSKIDEDGVYGITFDITNASGGSFADRHSMHSLGQAVGGLFYVPFTHRGQRRSDVGWWQFFRRIFVRR